MHYNDEMVEILKLLPADYALRNGFSPVEVTRGRLKIAVSNQNYQNLIDEIEFIVERTVLVETRSREEVLGQIANLYGINLEDWEGKGQEYLPVEKEHINLSDSDIFGDDKHSVVPFVNRLISEAIRERASDIHLERYEGIFRIRFRIDGALIEHLPPYSAYPEMIISRLKIMAGMDIAEKRRPQDGRIRMENHQSKIDLRVSTLPTEFGEKMVLRILNKQAVALSLDSLGFDKKLLADLTKVLNLPYGMILLTGPTGSGKTTTLYSALNFLNKTDVNIISIEDPIEYNLSGINQIRVRPDLNLNFAAILRTILRQDPDVIMVGEIRDTETAEIAVRAALTGHLVLSTLHTNDSLSTLIRLIDMGIDPFLIAHSLKMVIAQRLIRKICPACKTVDENSDSILQNFPVIAGFINKKYYSARGCSSCHFTGYSGRTVVGEFFVMDEDYVKLILQKSDMSHFRRLTDKKGYRKLPEIAMEKAFAGETSLEEVIRETVVF